MADDPYASLGTIVSAAKPAAGDPYAAMGDATPTVDAAPPAPTKAPTDAPEGWGVGTAPQADGSVRRFAINPNGKDIVWLADKPRPATAMSVIDGIADTGTFGFGDELIGARDAAKAFLAGGDPAAAYAEGRDRIRGDMAAEEQDHPYARMAGQILGGLGIPAGGAEDAAFQAGRLALRSGATRVEARAIASRAATRYLAGTGAAVGGAYGFGSADGDTGERLLGATIGAAEGGAGGAALGFAGQALAPKVAAGVAGARAAAAPTLTEGQEVAAAAARQQIEPLAADVGGPTVRRATAGAMQLPFSAAPVANAAQRVVDQSQAARDRIASNIGQVLDPEAAGQKAIEGARAYINRSSAQGNALYNAAEASAAGTRVTPTGAIATLDRNIRELSETPGGGDGLTRLQGLRDALSQGDFSIQGIRNMRTALRDDFASSGLRGSDIERRVNQVVDAAQGDIVGSLNANGQGKAAGLYQKADDFWRNRVSTIDNTLRPIIGTDAAPKSGEEVVANLQRAARGNNDRLVSFMGTLAPAEQGDVRASLIGQLGRAASSAQDETGNRFSLQTFLTHWDKIGESAKRNLFGPEGKAALNDLAIVARGSRDAQAYANRSNTGGAVEFGRIISAITALPTFGATIGGQYAVGRLLANPAFARWLARAPKTSLSQPAYLDRLTRIARANPVIANDLTTLYNRLADAGSTSLARGAANEPDDKSSRVDR